MFEENLGKAQTDTKLVVDEPDLSHVDDAHTTLTLLDAVDRDKLALGVVRFSHEFTSRLGHDLELDGIWIFFLTRAHEWLVKCFLHHLNVVRLSKPFLGVCRDRLDDSRIKFLELVGEYDGLFVVRINRQIERIRRLVSRLISESAQTVRASHEWKLHVKLALTVGSVNVYCLATVLVLLHLAEDDRGRIESAGKLDHVRGAGMALRFAIGTHNLLAIPRWRTFKRVVKPYFTIALPAMLTQISTPFGNYLLTGIIAGFGDDAVAAWAVVNRLTVVVFGGIFSLSGAIGGIYGQNFGARQYDRLRQTFRDSLVFCIGYTVVAWILLCVSAGWVVQTFGLSGEGAEVYNAFAYVGSAAFVMVGALFVSNATFNSLGKPTRSTISNWSRDGLLMWPIGMLGAAWFAAPGVVYAQAVAGGLAGLLAALWSWHFLKGIGQEA